MYDNPDFSVCVVTGEQKTDLLRFLDAVLKNDNHLRLEVIVVNQNLPYAELVNYLEGFSGHEILDCPAQLSKPRVFNLALRKCKGRYVSLWDQESLPEPACLLILAEFLDKNPEVGLAVPKLRNKRGVIQPVARSLPGFFSFLYPFGLPGRTAPGWSDYSSGEAPWLTGPGLTINRYLLEEIGCFSEELPTLWSLDLCLRALKAGWHCCYRHDAQAVADISQWLGRSGNPGLQLWEKFMVTITRLRFM
ncbi:MAG: glycosyltransferase family 2 protein [Thermodesulfobacteriota bacterium]